MMKPSKTAHLTPVGIYVPTGAIESAFIFSIDKRFVAYSSYWYLKSF
jgi:hypothetical protein